MKAMRSRRIHNHAARVSAEHINKLFALPQRAAAILGDFITRDRWRAVSPRRPNKGEHIRNLGAFP
ncbi:MAG: hypothetical protein WAU56_13210 [Steroidobacteraceae bacterium]